MTTLSLKQLQHAGRTPPVPTTLQLSDGEKLTIKQWLRILPDKRYVAHALKDGQPVLAKFFVGPRNNSKLTRERQGIQRLIDANINTPAILQHHREPDGSWLLTEFLTDGQDLYSLTQRSQDTLDQSLKGAEYGEAVAKQVALLHNAQLAQSDGHPGNFMFQHKQCFVLDGADVVPLTTNEERCNNLAQLLAQMPQTWWRLLFDAYQCVATHAQDFDSTYQAALAVLAWRGKNVADKSVRDCTQFQVQQSFSRFQSVLRIEADHLAPLLANLDQAIENGQPLKQGGSSTVAKIDWRGQALVIKRYNLKSWHHRVSRCFRHTRAWHSWQGGHRLRTLGIATPEPIAMVEERFGPLRGRGYLITACSSGSGLVQAVEDGGEQTLASLITELQVLLRRFREHHISHGDFKATNLLWDKQQPNALSLIDLDVICWHQQAGRWRKHYQKDVKRLLRNWQDKPELLARFQQALTNNESA